MHHFSISLFYYIHVIETEWNDYIVGIKIKAEFPLKPDIIIHNNFDKKINILSKNLIRKIKDKIDD